MRIYSPAMTDLMSMLSGEGMEVLTYLGSFYTMSLDRKKPV